jgi:hypothetical protein
MKLSYRGVTYEYNQPTLEVTEGEILGHYRGVHWRCRTVIDVPASPASHVLKYRGVEYLSNSDLDTDVYPVNAVQDWHPRVAFSQVAKLRAKTASRKLADTHRSNLQNRLEQRLKAARDRGDNTLLSLLEAERKELSL